MCACYNNLLNIIIDISNEVLDNTELPTTTDVLHLGRERAFVAKNDVHIQTTAQKFTDEAALQSGTSSLLFTSSSKLTWYKHY